MAGWDSFERGTDSQIRWDKQYGKEREREGQSGLPVAIFVRDEERGAFQYGPVG